MHYLVDGHNLIGKCRTLRLGDPDDEAQLIALLHRWVVRRGKHQMTVVFDGGVYGHPATLDRPGIRAVFAYSPQDADTRLITMIERISEPSRYRAVSSDHAITRAAAHRNIAVIDAAAFAAEIEQPIRQNAASLRSTPRRPRPEPKVVKTEVEYWLREFGASDEPPQP